MSKNPTRSMPLMGHLTELRKRITYVAIVVVVFMIAAFIEKKYVFAVLMHPLPDKYQLTTLGVTEAFMVVLKVSIYAGLICGLPFILYQFWAFILPGLYENERRNTITYTIATTGLFIAGIAFAYFVALPYGLKFMVEYGAKIQIPGASSGVFNQLLGADRYLTFVSMFELAFGLVFELPLVMMLLAWAGIVDHKKMKKWRKYAILVEAVIAMVLTPSQDPVSMALMLVPLIVLYEFGIVLARVAVTRRTKRREAKALAAAEQDARKLEEAETTGPQIAG